jgi:hypothetical protein
MADTKISALTPITPVVGTQLIPISTVGLLNGSITPAGILSYGTSPITGTTVTATTNYIVGSADANISRISAGVIGVGTGAAGSVAGSLSLTSITLNTGGQILGAGGVVDFGFSASSLIRWQAANQLDFYINSVLAFRGSSTVLTANVPLAFPGYAIASLPTGVTGMVAYVTDQITAAAAKGVAPTAGGAIKCLVFYNGTAWVGA